jgi:APA family basic amino acid/polyamine antiporter
MAQDMGPGPILLAWVVGAVLALSGARAYAAVAQIVPRSGGEYRYLSELLHPAVGYLSGWASLLVGFSAPVAVDAIAAGAFAKTVFPALDPQWTGVAFVAVLTGLHVGGLETSARTQNALVAVKVLLLAGFVAVGLGYGVNAWPGWQPPGGSSGFPLAPFVRSLFFVAFAFSGWNAVIYAAEEFHVPERTVPRAMLIGCALVAVLYLVVNWIFVANLTPADAAVVFRYESDRVTLGHAVVSKLVGAGGGKVMSLFTIAVFLSAMSAMIFVGPRVYAAMARDGYLPRALAGRDGRPPVGSILLQSALSVVIVFTHPIRAILENVGAILVLFSALVAVGLFWRALSPAGRPRPGPVALAAAAVYVLASSWMFWFAFRGATHLLAWIGVIAAVGLGAYAASRRGAAAAARASEG